MSRSLSAPATIYFVLALGQTRLIKIGATTNMRQRFNSLVASSPVEMEEIGSFDGFWFSERMLHRDFLEEHERHEWFHASSRLLNFVLDARDKGALPRKYTDVLGFTDFYRNFRLGDPMHSKPRQKGAAP